MNGLKADLLHALRLYLKTPASSVLAVAILAAAMAIVTAFLSLWNDLALRPHAGFEDGGGLITVGQSDGRRFFPVPPALIERASEEATAIDSIAGIGTLEQRLERDDEAEPLTAELVTSEYFPGLRPQLRIGRPFDERDHDQDAAPVVIVSHAFWQSELDGRADVLGETLQLWSRSPYPPDAELRSQDYRVVGVLAPELTGTFPGPGETSVWHPREQVMPFVMGDDGPAFSMVRAIARLTPGASVRAARTELEGRFGDLLGDFRALPGARLDVIAGLVSNASSHREALRQIRLFLAGSVLLTLVAACNVSLFLLSRAPGRRRELAIRMAVGAPTKRLARQLVTESSLLVVAATIAGLVASVWVSVFISELAFLQQARWRDVTAFDWRVLGMIVGFMLVLTMLVSLAPVAGLRRIGIAAGSRAVTARPGWGQRLAGTAQITAAAVIAACALAFVWYLNAVSNVDRGFSATDVLVMRSEQPEFRGPAPQNADAASQEREHRRNVIGALPGVEAVAFATAVPGAPAMTLIMQAAPPDDPQASFSVDGFSVDASYFELLDLSLVDGRVLDARDEIVINETLAHRLWGRTDVAGELFPASRPPGVEAPLPEVVGVVRDVTFGHPSDDVPPTAFRLLSGRPSGFELTLIRTSASAADIRQLVQQRIDAGELDFAIQSIERVEQAWSRVLAPDRARTTLTLASAVLVLVLTGFGYFGTQRFLVATGRREFAILAAVGAGPNAIGRLVLARGLGQGLPGLVLGSLLAFVVVAWLRDGFFSSAVPPAAVAMLVAAGIAGLLLAATLGPARQARKTQPAPLLREE